jgi:DNA primase
MRYPSSLLDEIRARLPVSSVVGRRVQLQRRGREFVGLSPFKAEKTPSFTVNDRKGFYHCFSSGEHGDIFGFLMKTEGLSFAEAIERLAAEAGVPLPKPSARESENEDKRARLMAAMEAAARHFETNLASSRGREAREYLDRRKIPPQLAKRFRMGLATGGRFDLREHLAGLGFATAEMVEAGLLIAGDDIPVPYDRFRERLIIPILDLRNKVIAFGGRTLAPDGKPKYLNSPESPLFHKGSVLFNAGSARQAAHEAGAIYVVEGYLDVVAMVGAGIDNAVAPLGTALTEAQLGLLWRMAGEPVLCFDGDVAGQKAAQRAVETALPQLAPGRSLRFAFLPEGLDPDDLIRQQGSAALKATLARTAPLIDVLWARERDSAPSNTPERRAELERRIAQLVQRIGDPQVRDHYRQELRQLVRHHTWSAIKMKGLAPREKVASGRGGRAKAADWRAREKPPWLARQRTLPSPVASSFDDVPRGGVARSLGPAVPHREAIILTTLINHPGILDVMSEEIADICFANADLGRLRDAMLEVHARWMPLDRSSFANHLEGLGQAEAIGLVARAITNKCDRFADVDAPSEAVEAGIRHAMALQHREFLATQGPKAVDQSFLQEGYEAASARLLDVTLRRQAEAVRIHSVDPAVSGRLGGTEK